MEATRVTLPVVVDASGVTEFTTDLGYVVQLSSYRIALADLELTAPGETHGGLFQKVQDVLLRSAWGHPGHSAGGDVIGELPGRFIVDWARDENRHLGDATLIEGTYKGANFTFERGSSGHNLEATDPLVGSTAQVAGVATKGDLSVAFEALLEVDADTKMVGAPLRLTVSSDTRTTLGFRALTIDPVEGDTLLDGIDFGSLSTEAGDAAQVRIGPGDEAHNRARRALQDHDFYEITTTETT